MLPTRGATCIAHPFAYDAKYENCAKWGERRWVTPGMVAYENLLIAFDLIKNGNTKTATTYTVPQNHRIGVGF